MKLDDVVLRFLFEIFIFIESLFWILIESLKIRDVWLLLNKVWIVFLKLLDKHTELSSPITNVINSMDIVSLIFEYSADTITLNGWSQMTNMHVLGNIWRWKINEYSFWFRFLFFFVLGHLNLSLNFVNSIDSLVNKLILNENVDEPLSFVIWSISHLFHFNFFDCTVICWNLLHDGGSHVHAALETKTSFLFVFVENLHSAWWWIVPSNGSVFLLIVFGVNLNNIS